MSSAARSVVCFVALGASSACALLTDFSGLSGGAQDAALGDGPSVAIDSSAPSSGSSASSSGSTASSSGGVPDSGRGSDAEASVLLGFCASHAPVEFCDDFDEPNRTSMAEKGWSAPQNAGARLTGASLTSEQSTSSPRAARMIVDPNAPGGVAADQKGITFPANAARVRVQLQVRPRAGGQSPVLSLRYGPRDCTLEYYPDPGLVVEKCEADYWDFSGAPSLLSDQWNEVAFTLERAPDGVRYKFLIEARGTPFGANVHYPDVGQPLDVGVTVLLGNSIVPVEGPQVSVIDYDDVVVVVE